MEGGSVTSYGGISLGGASLLRSNMLCWTPLVMWEGTTREPIIGNDAGGNCS